MPSAWPLSLRGGPLLSALGILLIEGSFRIVVPLRARGARRGLLIIGGYRFGLVLNLIVLLGLMTK